MRKIFQYILMTVALVAAASCSNELDEVLQPAGNGSLQFVVSDFPAFGESPDTRVIGTQDVGKTAWEEGDKLLLSISFESGKKQGYTLEYLSGVWTLNDKVLASSDITGVLALYAPDCEIKSDGSIGLASGKLYGMAEYIPAKTSVDGLNVSISFKDVTRTYSRLRIAGLANQTLTVTTTDFTPAGMNSEITDAYTFTVTADENGNAYLYGTFAEGATVIVKQGDITLKDYTFTAEKNPNGTVYNKSYALDATPVIDGTLGGKTEATEDDITALVELLKSYIENGHTTIIVTGCKSAIITVGNITETAIGEAIYRLSGNGNYDENNPYNGKIDLVLPDVTEIVAMEFYAAFALNSITLPKVTTIGDMAFQGCDHLTKLTFGSVLTTIDEHDGLMFWVGEKVDGCDLFLNCGQMNSQYVPDLATNTWTILHTNEFKSITLTHTGDCDECKANQ